MLLLNRDTDWSKVSPTGNHDNKDKLLTFLLSVLLVMYF